MYTEWISLSPIIEANSNGAQSQSVLNKFSGAAGREVAVAIVKQLANSLGLTQPAEPNSLAKTLNDDEVTAGHLIYFRKNIPFVTFSDTMVHECHLLWPVTATVRTRNHQRLCQRLL